MKAKKSNYKAAADYTRRCRTLAALARRERSNQRLYQNGCLTVSQYARLASIEMDMAIKLENTTMKRIRIPQPHEMLPPVKVNIQDLEAEIYNQSQRRTQTTQKKP